MALNEQALAQLMITTFGFFTPGAIDEWEAIAAGTIAGLKLGTANVVTAGKSGAPAPGTGLGAINPGPLVMAPIVAANSVGTVPPIPGGVPTPLQPIWYLAVAQIATHVLTNLQVTAPPTDAVAVGVGTIAPGGFQISPTAIEQAILLEYLTRGLNFTPMRTRVASLIGRSVQQHMLLATMIIPLAGTPSPEPSGVAGVRTGVIS